MLGSSKIKLINSLRHKKYREKNGLYIIEGDKMVREFLESGKKITTLLVTPGWKEKNDESLILAADETITVTDKELKKISLLSTPPGAVAIVAMEEHLQDLASLAGTLTVGLENIQDPGNLGTLIRIAAWFGIGNIICSKNTVDVYNPKVLQATMGAIIHVNVIYTDLMKAVSELKKAEMPVFATTLDGEPLNRLEKTNSGLLLFGNESRGLSKEMTASASHRIRIPAYRQLSPGIESLNVAASAAIICHEFRRESG